MVAQFRGTLISEQKFWPVATHRSIYLIKPKEEAEIPETVAFSSPLLLLTDLSEKV